jgi:hypothetical protein
MALKTNDATQYLAETSLKLPKYKSYAYNCKIKVKNLRNSLKSKALCGYDQISTNPLRSWADYISVPLGYLCSQLMAVGVFPECLKYSKVKPLY